MTVSQLPTPEPSRVITTPHGPVTIEPNRPFLYCDDCGGEYSANPGDYFMAARDKEMTCCGEPMRLVRRRVLLEDVV